MWCNQIFSLIKNEIVLSISEQEFNELIDKYLSANSNTEMTLEEAQEHVLDTVESTTEQVVANIIVCDNYEIANQLAVNGRYRIQLARASYGNDAIAIDTTLIPVAINDVYNNGNFYRNGILIPPNPTQEQEIETLKAENAELLESTIDNDYRLSIMELGL
ncbi:MAG: hypothetical protein Q4E24_14465 [bacterium]|nr:hypothetical protein [bacterium]